jgi:hypothetical protein
MVPLNGTTLRFDTTAPFADPASWSAFDLTTVAPSTKAYLGGAFDGRFVYFVPWAGQANPTLVRYDSTASFSAQAAWSALDLRTIPSGGFSYGGGAIFDGRFLYIPCTGGTTVLRFDAKSPPSMPALPAFSGSFL